FAVIIMIVISLTFYPSYIWIILLVGANKILDLHSELYYSLPHLKSDFDIIGKLMIAKHLIMLITFFITLLISKDLILSLMIQLIIQAILLLFLERKILKKLYLSNIDLVIWSDVGNIVKSAIPLGLSMMLVSLTANIPKYILEYVDSAESLGYLTAINYILVVGNLMMKSISQNFLPRLSSIYREKNKKEFKKNIYVYLTGFSIFLGILVIVGTYFLGELFLFIVYGDNFVEYFD